MREKVILSELSDFIFSSSLTTNQLFKGLRRFFCQYLLFLDHVDFSVNCFAPALNLYLTIEASSGVLLYTLLSSREVFPLVT